MGFNKQACGPSPVPITHFAVGPVVISIERIRRTFVLTVQGTAIDGSPKSFTYRNRKHKVYRFARRAVVLAAQEHDVPEHLADAALARLDRLQRRPFWRD